MIYEIYFCLLLFSIVNIALVKIYFTLLHLSYLRVCEKVCINMKGTKVLRLPQ